MATELGRFQHLLRGANAYVLSGTAGVPSIHIGFPHIAASERLMSRDEGDMGMDLRRGVWCVVLFVAIGCSSGSPPATPETPRPGDSQGPAGPQGP